MVYLINGEKSLIDKEVNDLIKKYNTTSIIKYDLVFNKISDVINDINTVNLFLDKKVIICSSINNIDNIDKCIDYTGKIYLKRKGEYSLFNLDGGCGMENENKIYTLFTTKNYSIYIGGTYSFDNNSYGYITLKYTKITK